MCAGGRATLWWRWRRALGRLLGGDDAVRCMVEVVKIMLCMLEAVEALDGIYDIWSR